MPPNFDNGYCEELMEMEELSYVLILSINNAQRFLLYQKSLLMQLNKQLLWPSLRSLVNTMARKLMM